MKQTQRTVEVTEVTLNTLEDCIDLLKWCQTQDGLSVAVVSRVDGAITVQAEGFTVPTVYADLGDVIRWDGTMFSVDKAGQ